MAYTVFLSRAGLTRCPGCNAHFRVERSEATEATCPFCAAALRITARSDSRSAALSRLANVGRSGLIAASLFGVAAIGSACDDTEEPEPDGTVTATPVYGIPADQVDPPNDTSATTDPTTADATTGDVAVEDAADTLPVAEYGIPPDATSDDMTVEDAADAGFEPEYGIPPDAAP